MTPIKTSLVLGTSIFIGLASGASAATLDAESLIAGSTAIVLGDLSTSATSHVEGTVYVGGDLSSSTFDANRDGLADLDLGTVSGSLIVGGDLTANLNGAQVGTVAVGGTYTGNPGTETVVTGADVPVSEVTSLFENLSTDLSSFEDTAGASISGDSNNVVFNTGNGGADTLAFLNLDAAYAVSLFSNQNANISFNFGDINGFIINVAGDIGDIDLKLNDSLDNVLFNFYESTELDFGGGPFNASILAPFADVTSAAGGTNGTVIAGNLTLGGEIRPFNDTNGYVGGLPVIAPVPLPAAAWLMFAAIGSLVGLRRRSVA